jgi:DNA-binding CsgD family transcriptional regulator
LNDFCPIKNLSSACHAEREVAILATKGFSIAEIAVLRKTNQGTTRAQCASVFEKADVAGRLLLLSVFLEDLMSDDLVKTAQQATK